MVDAQDSVHALPDPGRLAACPAPGAIVQYENGIVDVDFRALHRCGLWSRAVVRRAALHAGSNKNGQVHALVDRVSVASSPPLHQGLPTGFLQFGTRQIYWRWASTASINSSGPASRRRRSTSAGGGRNQRDHRAPTAIHPECTAAQGSHRPGQHQLWKASCIPSASWPGPQAIFGAIGHFMAVGPKKPPPEKGGGAGMSEVLAGRPGHRRRRPRLARTSRWATRSSVTSSPRA